MRYLHIGRVKRYSSRVLSVVATAGPLLAAPTMALAQAVTGGYSPQTMLSNACAFVLGPFGQSIAVLFIMGLGIAWMAGRASLHLLGQVIGGIVLLFGAAYLQQTLTGSGN